MVSSVPTRGARTSLRWKGPSNMYGRPLRVQVRLDLCSGQMQGPWLQAGREPERSGPAQDMPLPAGCLYTVDLGYFTLPEMRRHGREGHFWLTQAKAHLKVYDQRGQCWDLLDLLEAQSREQVVLVVQVGGNERLPARLIAVRLSPLCKHVMPTL